MSAIINDWLQNQDQPVFFVKWPNESFITAFVLAQNTAASHHFYWVPFNGVMEKFAITNTKTFEVALPKKYVVTHLRPSADSVTQENQHHELVQKALDAITLGALEKVVVARKSTYLIEKFDPESTFLRLAAKYAHAAVYWFYKQNAPNWMGATPELLLKSDGNIFHTVSLAGTRPHRTTGAWGLKEIAEQQVVTDFISNTLKNLGVPDLKISAPATAPSGPIEHLKSKLEWHMPHHTNAPMLQLLEAMHPTPAVCGLPRDAAKKFLLQNENFEREAYAGYFGLGDAEGQRGKYFVNLRCLQWHGELLHLYAGGGINSGSNPQAEWVETENKLQTLLAVL